jgi:hypothetical protein
MPPRGGTPPRSGGVGSALRKRGLPLKGEVKGNSSRSARKAPQFRVMFADIFEHLPPEDGTASWSVSDTAVIAFGG